MPIDPVQKAGELIRIVNPTPDREYEGRHATPRDGILSVLRESQSNKLGEFPVVTGVRGTPIERMHQVLADYLSRHDALAGHTKVMLLNLDPVRRLAKIHDENAGVSSDVLQVALEKARTDH